MVNVGTRDARRRDAFLSGLATGQSVSVAASACGISRASVYRWRERSARFARQWDDAVEGGADLLEHEAWRRAVEGTARPVFAKGQQVGEVRQYSDRLLMFLLQAKRPQVYRPRPAPGARQPEIPEDLGRRVKAARERAPCAAATAA